MSNPFQQAQVLFNDEHVEGSMEHSAEWKIKLYLFEHDTGSTAQVTLETGANILHGEGRAGQYPDGRALPEIDPELAAGRALADLGSRLIQAAAKDEASAAVNP